ncbi:VOC family protein [Nocardioides panacisoli]|uniref:VOC family protein n=1 Tax=Nocardioides panacisoli TaxID=627624 RepID=A0ABP7ILF9_9ACTN
MASQLNPYISFKDTAQAAMEFYKSVLGGELTISRFSDMGGEGDGVMHSSLVTSDGLVLFAADTPEGMDYTPAAGISISLSGDDESLRGYFDGLAEGGTVTVPLEKQVWGDEFGMVLDKFGISWMVNISPASA